MWCFDAPCERRLCRLGASGRCPKIGLETLAPVCYTETLTDLIARSDAAMFVPEAFLNQFIYYPDRNVSVNPHVAGLSFQNVWLTTRDQVRLHGWWLPRDDAAATLLFLHGNAGNIMHRLQNLVLLVEEIGLQVLIIDYRGYGKSDGVPNEAGLYQDAAAAWHWLITETAGPHLIFGRSLGGAVAVWLATEGGATPAGLVLENTFTRGQDLAAQVLPFPAMASLLPDFYPTVHRIEQLGAPLLLIHSEQDELIARSHGDALYAAAPDPKELYIVAGGHHNDAFMVGGQEYIARWRAFVRRDCAPE